MAARYADLSDPGRRWPRRAASVTPNVEMACAGGGPAMPVRLVDVSTFGCRVAAEGAEAVGDHVRLGFGDRAPVTATVVWRRAGAIGCRFDKPIPTTLMKTLICGDG